MICVKANGPETISEYGLRFTNPCKAGIPPSLHLRVGIVRVRVRVRVYTRVRAPMPFQCSGY